MNASDIGRVRQFVIRSLALSQGKTKDMQLADAKVSKIVANAPIYLMQNVNDFFWTVYSETATALFAQKNFSEFDKLYKKNQALYKKLVSAPVRDGCVRFPYPTCVLLYTIYPHQIGHYFALGSKGIETNMQGYPQRATAITIAVVAETVLTNKMAGIHTLLMPENPDPSDCDHYLYHLDRSRVYRQSSGVNICGEIDAGRFAVSLNFRLAGYDNIDKMLNHKKSIMTVMIVVNCYRHLTYPALYALQLLTCKNLRTKIEKSHDRLSNHQKRLKQTGPNIKYHVLDVPLINRIANGEFALHETKKLPLHTVAGHFKTYTAEKPMLGKHVGTYWWHPFLKGAEQQGIVYKDYHPVMRSIAEP